MRNFKIILLSVAIVLAALSPVAAQGGYSVPSNKVDISAMSVAELWDQANTSYANEDYVNAIKRYKEILNRDLYSADLYYNLANVYHKRGKVGLSLLNYYKAQRLSPTDGDIQHNIEVASLGTQDNITRMPRLFIFDWDESISTMLNCMSWSVLSLVMFALMMASILLYLLTTRLSLRRFGFWGLVTTLLLFAVTTRYAVNAKSKLLHPDEAIVMKSSVSITSSPNPNSTELFILHEGTKVHVEKSVDSWYEIVLDDGKKGWVQSKSVERI